MGNLGQFFPIRGSPSRGFVRCCSRAAHHRAGSGREAGPRPPFRLGGGAEPWSGAGAPEGSVGAREGAPGAHSAGEARPPSPLPAGPAEAAAARGAPRPPFCAVEAAGGAAGEAGGAAFSFLGGGSGGRAVRGLAGPESSAARRGCARRRRRTGHLWFVWVSTLKGCDLHFGPLERALWWNKCTEERICFRRMVKSKVASKQSKFPRGLQCL